MVTRVAETCRWLLYNKLTSIYEILRCICWSFQKFKVKFVPFSATKASAGVDVWSTHSSLRHRMEVSGLLYAPPALTPTKNTSTHWIRGWVDPRNVLGVFGENNTFSPARMIISYGSYENDQQDAIYRLIYYSKSALHLIFMDPCIVVI